MKKKLSYLLLIIVTLGSLFLAFGWSKYQKADTQEIPEMQPTLAQAMPYIPPQSASQFLRGKF